MINQLIEECKRKGGEIITQEGEQVCAFPEQELKQEVEIITDQDECTERGGTWGKYGLAQIEGCNIPTEDAGKECKKGVDCTTQLCIAIEGNTDHGTCPEWTMNFGCFTLFDEDQAKMGQMLSICID